MLTKLNHPETGLDKKVNLCTLKKQTFSYQN